MGAAVADEGFGVRLRQGSGGQVLQGFGGQVLHGGGGFCDCALFAGAQGAVDRGIEIFEDQDLLHHILHRAVR